MKNVFKAPAWLLMIATFFIPMAIIAIYSVLTRGGYGGIERPFTLENYTRLFDPLYGVIFARSVWIAALEWGRATIVRSSKRLGACSC